MKDKVGIVSMQRVVNYGSFMQAYGLRRLMLESGAQEADFIDIAPGRQLPGYESKSGLKPKIAKLAKLAALVLSGKTRAAMRRHSFRKQLEQQFHSEFHPMLGLGKDRPQSRDLVVIGSDEVFNACQPSSWGFTRQLFGDVPDAKAVISYAASFGHTTLDQLRRAGIDGEIAECLGRMQAISVRDTNSAEIVEALTGRKPLMHLDPVLIYDFTAEREAAPKPDEQGYLLLYFYQDRLKNAKEIAAIRRYARERGKRIVALFGYYDWADRCVLPSTPFELLNWFAGADEIVTDTFHGTIFSIITGGNFTTVVRNSNRQKLTSLLATLGLEGRVAHGMGDIGRVLASPPDYTCARSVIERERTRTRQYLKQA